MGRRTFPKYIGNVWRAFGVRCGVVGDKLGLEPLVFWFKHAAANQYQKIPISGLQCAIGSGRHFSHISEIACSISTAFIRASRV